jgi:hypothetical protein
MLFSRDAEATNSAEMRNANEEEGKKSAALVRWQLEQRSGWLELRGQKRVPWKSAGQQFRRARANAVKAIGYKI